MVKYQTPEKIKLKFDSIGEDRLFWLGRSVVDIGCNKGLLAVDGHHGLSILYAMGIKLTGTKTCI